MIATRVGDVSTIVLPKKKRYWNYYALQMRSVVNSVKTGIHISTVTGSGKGARTSSVPVKASIVYDNLATGKPEEIAGQLKAKYGKYADRLSIYAPYAGSDAMWKKIVAELKA